jgi:hypothetical protein
MPNVTDYINSIDYDELTTKLKQLVEIHDDLNLRAEASRKLRYAEVDIEAERSANKLQADEAYIPQHIIDTNIRREQSAYIQYVTQSPRAVITKDIDDPSVDMSLLDTDLTRKLRFDGWQLGMYSNIDSFQAHGYSVMETVYDKNAPGCVSREHVQYENFAFISDTKDLQAVEMTSRRYWFTRTKLLELVGDGPDDFVKAQTDKIIEQMPESDSLTADISSKDSSMFKIYKFMFRVHGIVVVAWGCPNTCDGWLRIPRPLFVGRKTVQPSGNPIKAIKAKLQGIPESINCNETQYPYFLYPYAISEDSTISNLRGRVFLDSDLQEAVTSLTSSLVTKVRRSAGLYFVMDDNDPNGNILMDKNISFKTGMILKGKITELKLDAPDATLFNAVQGLVSSNANETSQVNFAETNRQADSRKTAKAIEAAQSQAQQLTTVQVVLFSIALKEQFTYETDIIKSRVQAGLIKVNPAVMPLYARTFEVKPSGDTDVIERQQLVSLMMQSWPVIQNTPLAQAFFLDLIKMLFPNSATNYTNILQQAAQQQQQQQQSAQAQQMQTLSGLAQQAGSEVTELAKHPEFFSDTGRVNIFPKIQMAAEQVKQMTKQQQQQQQQQKK